MYFLKEIVEAKSTVKAELNVFKYSQGWNDCRKHIIENLETDGNKILLKALETIKSVCNGECENCPLGNDEGDCLLNETEPGNWKLNDESTIWRALL